ncbi:MAG TPA: hypothetical protein VL359_17275, partial [bacterium]|nr:hypothetical protein [bacterium]
PALLSVALRLEASSSTTWADLVSDPAAEQFLRVNEFEGVRWFSKEALELFAQCVKQAWITALPDAAPVLAAAETTGYRWDVFVRLLAVKAEESPAPPV